MLGLQYSCKSPEFYEKIPRDDVIKNIMEVPEFFAVQKALSISCKSKSALVISYDTAVVHKKKILGKPANPQEALEMLKLLNGTCHQVITGVALTSGGKILFSANETTDVTFACVKDEVLKNYAFSKEPEDKAGAYAIQGRGAILVKKINGCYYNVMGVPVQLTLRSLEPYFS